MFVGSRKAANKQGETEDQRVGMTEEEICWRKWNGMGLLVQGQQTALARRGQR